MASKNNNSIFKYVSVFLILFIFGSVKTVWSGEIIPTLYVSFDNDFIGIGLEGDINPKKILAPHRVKGKYGNALKTSALLGHLKYPASQIFNPEEGTVEFWVKAIDWVPGDDNFHVFFEAKSDGAIYLYKYFQDSKLLMLATNDHKYGPYFSSGAKINWNKNEWHHVAGTWSSLGVLLYIDGEPISKAPVEATLPSKTPEFFSIGNLPWHSLRLGTTLIDEFRIYNKSLTPRQIKARFNNQYSELPYSKDSFSVNYKVDMKRENLEISLIMDHMVQDEKVEVLFELEKESQTMLHYKNISILTGNDRVINTVPLASLKPGKYKLSGSVYYNKQLIATKTAIVNIPDRKWNVSNEDLFESVIPPWEPIEFYKGIISVWGREYNYSYSALPEQLMFKQQALLTEPVNVKFNDGSGLEKLRSSRPEYTISKKKAWVTITSTLNKENSNTEEIITVSNKTEFDGLSVISLTSNNQHLIKKSDHILIDIPITSASALYRHKWAEWYEWSDEISGALPGSLGKIDSSSFIPFYWIGNNDSGLFWFSETGKMWPNSNSSDAIQVIRTKDRVTLRLNIKKPGQELPYDWEFTFGLQVTPVKPMVENWRTWRLVPSKQANMEIIWPTPTEDSFKYYGYPEVNNKEIFSARIDKLHKKGIKAIPYIAPTYLSTQSPEWSFWKRNWSMHAVDSSSSDVRAYGGGFAAVSPVDGTWGKFISSKVEHFFSQYNVDGIYYDNVQPHGAFAPNAGLGYIQDGKKYKEYPILAYREVLKALYYKIKSKKPDAIIIAHTSGKINIPALSFVDAYLNGEQFRGKLHGNYSNILPLESFRAEFMGRQWGLAPIFLPQFNSTDAKDIKPTESMMSMLLLHDVNVWPIWSNVEYINKVTSILDDFDINSAEFIPYFSHDAIATSNNKDILVSAYCQSSGLCLLIIGNMSAKKHNVKVCAQVLNLTGIVDAFAPLYSNVTYEVHDGCANLNIVENGTLFIKAHKFKQIE